MFLKLYAKFCSLESKYNKYKEAKKLGDTLVHEEAERKCAQEEKQKKRMKVVNFKL